MKYTKAEKYLKIATDLTKARPKSRQEKFFKEEIASIISHADYHELIEDDIQFLKNAKFEP